MSVLLPHSEDAGRARFVFAEGKLLHVKAIRVVARSTEAVFLQFVEKWLDYSPMKKDEVVFL